jgi:hypothetical protein
MKPYATASKLKNKQDLAIPDQSKAAKKIGSFPMFILDLSSNSQATGMAGHS